MKKVYIYWLFITYVFHSARLKNVKYWGQLIRTSSSKTCRLINIYYGILEGYVDLQLRHCM
jgi:hypothetical protein